MALFFFILLTIQLRQAQEWKGEIRVCINAFLNTFIVRLWALSDTRNNKMSTAIQRMRAK